MKTWGLRFWEDHGDRLVFMLITTVFGAAFYYLMGDMQGEAKTLLIAVATLALNKARSTPKEEKKMDTPPATSGQSGRVTIAALALLLLIGGLGTASVIGCAGQRQQSATEQMAAQTSDPALLAMATYADALEAYVSAQDLYLPYAAVMARQRPEAHNQVIGYFTEARKVLAKWKKFGAASEADKSDLRAWLRKISIEAALAAESGGAQ